ncbi:hypothetical protein HW450_00855 [Corynebacterium hindlerae]|uniref:Lycopene cyclase n=1 Tax=Corynebacterium hindlerae TaxID=699041 RepID=A0A7G5FFF5_9CORY|nr:lycopene cyclase family protein [Corynebacterium hindlerae]QMV85346.1 hypothetical protein HW450_00855 [Corynebacterium hindlerae]
MSTFDMIILGLGPAGAYLGHRATARGLKVLGIDPAAQWTATYGGWVDELADAPLFWRGFPSVRFGGLGYQLDREYGIIDNSWRERLLNFEVLQESAEITSAYSVRVAGVEYQTQMLIDARGATPQPPYQQAFGVFLDSGPVTWMDFHGETFQYSFPTPRGHLVEETLLVTATERPWEQLASTLPQQQNTGEEKVLIPMGPQHYDSPALPYGARAGFINPVCGFSLGTSISLADATLDALWRGGPLPWRTRTFRADVALARRLQRVLLKLEPAQVQHLLKALLLSPFHARFLKLGDLPGTLTGMAWVFARVPLSTKAAILRALI